MVNIRKLFVLFLTCLILSGGSGILYSWHFFLKKSVLINSPTIKVDDIGTILGNDLDVKKRTAILNTVLADTPFKDTNLHSDDIRRLFENSSLFPESIRGTELDVHPDFKNYEGNEIEGFIRSQYGDIIDSKYKIKIQTIPVIPRVLRFQLTIDKSMMPGVKNATLKYKGFDNKDCNLILTYVLEKKISIVSALKEIQAGARLTKDNIIKMDQWIQQAAYQDSKDLFNEFPIGYVALRKIQKGNTISHQDASLKVDVHSGDKVVMKYSYKNIFIESEVRAFENGRLGQIIKFRTAGNRLVFGELTSERVATFTSREKTGE